MSVSVLVTYATHAGSTREIADTVAEVLVEKGLDVDVRPAKEVSTLSGFDAVVLGVSLYMFRWHKDARKFLSRHRKNLEELPVAVFGLGPLNDVEKEWQDARGHLEQELAKYPSLKPVGVEVFGGAFDADKLRFPYKMIPAMKNLPKSDIRNWDTIRSWAGELAEKFSEA